MNSFGMMLNYRLNKRKPTNFTIIAINDCYSESGSYYDICKYLKIDIDAIINEIKVAIKDDIMGIFHVPTLSLRLVIITAPIPITGIRGTIAKMGTPNLNIIPNIFVPIFPEICRIVLQSNKLICQIKSKPYVYQMEF